MGFSFWKRNTTDPLAKVIFSKYKFNLLSLPREDVKLGDLYTKENNDESGQLSYPGNVSNFLIPPPFKMPDPVLNEIMTDVSGTISGNISANVGVQFLENFLNTLGGGNFGTGIKGKFEHNGVKSLKFQFLSATRDRVDPFSLGNALKKYTFDKENAMYTPDRSYYIVAGIGRSNSISIIAEDDAHNAVDVGADVSTIANASGGVTVDTSKKGEITFKGEKKLAFGVELYKLTYDDVDKRFKLEPVSEAQTLRKEGEQGTQDKMDPELIEGSQAKDLFT